jgi:GT2 family glycosyltransferase/glycosyltransferase involved in cell wall biosynthesis
MARVSRKKKNGSAPAPRAVVEPVSGEPRATGRKAGQRAARAARIRVTDLGGENQLAAIGREAAVATDGKSAAATLATAEFVTAAMPEEDEARIGDRQDRAAPPDHPLQGYIDEANSSRITGWVWDPQQPESRIALELVDGDTRLAKATANQYRSDLRQAGIGDGRHAFAVLLAEGLLPSARNVLHLRCAETGTEVPGSPLIIERSGLVPASQGFREYLPASAIGQVFADPLDDPPEADPVADTPPVDRLANAAGVEPAAPWLVSEIAAVPDSETSQQSNIDFADWTGIKGWIWDRQEPQKRLVLELLDGGTALATVLANEYRPDLEQAGIGDGRHGFSIPFSETLLPYARHVLHLRPVGSKVEMPSFPLVLTREQAGLDPSVMRFILGNVMAEADRAEKPEDLAPIINAMVGFLDAALSRYFYIAEVSAANAADLLDPAELAPQVRTLIDSIQRSYPPIVIDTAREPLVSIVIPVFNKFDLTYDCVKSIVAHGAQIPFEIIIVDDCSRDETMFAAFAFGPEIRLIRNPENSGFIRSCNRGFEAARGEYIVFLNNDTEVRARWLDELYETMQRDPKIGVVGAKLLFPDGSLQECGGIVWRLGDGWNWGRGQAADDPRFCYMRDADYVSGAALMIKANLFAELGKFDEHYLPMYYEDTDLCFRVRQHGHRVVVQPASEIVHFEGASGGTSVTGTGMKRFQAINHRKFFERWKDTLASHRFNGELPDLEAERNVRQRALFIDDSVPEPDKDAGSNAAFQHMLSLQRLGYKVTFLPGDNMARIDPYTTELQRRGIECLYHPYYFSVEDVFRKQATMFDLVYLHRHSNASKYAGMIRQHFPSARILYNVADLHFLRMQRQAELQNDPSLREKAGQLRRIELGAMSFVDCVIVHSGAEAELLREIAPDIAVQVIPWTVPLRDITKMTVQKPGIAFIGGYRHPPNVDAAQWAARSIMPVLRGKVPGVELLLVGSHMPKEVSSLAAKDIVPLGYVPSLDSVFARIRLTIAPLRYGAGLKGKVLESMAAGVPCVMTTVAAEGIDLPEELKSLVADEPEALSERIATLCRDSAEYRRIVAAGKAHITANYSAERVDALIREACGAE